MCSGCPSSCSHLQILATLDGKVVIGHSVYNDFGVLDLAHPGHMVRDTSTSPLLSRLAGLSRRNSLKVLSRRLLNREIQVSPGGSLFDLIQSERWDPSEVLIGRLCPLAGREAGP